jgi:hypothetical protein
LFISLPSRSKRANGCVETSTLLTYTVYMFTQNTEILGRVREEVLEALGRDGTPTLEDIRQLKYRTLLVKENRTTELTLL